MKKYVLGYMKSISGFPSVHIEFLKKPEASPVVSGVNSWVNTASSNFLVLRGVSGTGKSFGAAYALYLLACKKNLPYWSRPDSWSKIGALWSTSYRLTTRDETFEEARVKPILIIDDLGSEVPTSASHCKIADIVSDRHGNERLTIMTTSMDMIEIGKTYGNATMERIFRNGKEVNCN